VIGLDDAIFHCLPPSTDDNDLDNRLDKVESTLAESIRVDKGNVKRRTWTSWFYLANLRVAREVRRKRRQHRPSHAASLFNRLVNLLFITEGEAAMGVYDGLEGRGTSPSCSFGTS
jgi:hypothetical protein